MATERDEEFRRFAAEQRRPLLRTAWLLTGSRGAAEDLVTTALLATHRRLRDPGVRADPLAAARRALVAVHTRRWPRTVRAPQAIGTMPEGTPDPRAVRDDEQLRDALQDLPPRLRAAVVLHLDADLDGEPLAAALGTDVEAARALTADGLARLALAVPVPAGGRTDPGTALRDRLDAASWRATAGGDDAGAADAVLALHRSRRLRAGFGAVAVAAVAVAAVVVPDWGGATDRFPTPATVSPPRPAVSVRGSLGTDPAFVDALRSRDWLHFGRPAPPLATRRVLFAGDAGGYRWGLVTGISDGLPVSAWFSGPVGAAAGDLTATSLEGSPPSAIAGTERSDAGGATVLVVASPGDEVLVSPGVVVGADGRGRREYRPVPVTDGVASARVPGANVGSSVRYRVLRGGTLVGTGPFSGDGVDLRAADALAATPPLRPSGAPATVDSVSTALSGVLQQTGLGADDVHPVLLWAASLPTSVGGTAGVAAVASTMPSGAVVVTTGISGNERGGGQCPTQVFPAGTRVTDVVVATGCILDLAGTATQRSFVVSAPPAATRVTLLNPAGLALATQPLTGGAAVVPDPGTVAFAVVSTPGQPDVRTAVPGDGPDPLQVG